MFQDQSLLLVDILQKQIKFIIETLLSVECIKIRKEIRGEFRYEEKKKEHCGRIRGKEERGQVIGQ